MPTGGNKKKELYEMMPEGTFASYEEFDAYVKDEGTLKEVYGFVPEGYFKDDAEYLGYFGDTVKKKEPSGQPSANGTPTTSPFASLSPAEKRRRLQEAAQGLGGKTPSTEVDVAVEQKREELAPKPIDLPRRDLTMPSDIPQPELPPDAPIIKPEDVKTGEKTAIDVAKEKFPQPIPKEEQMLSEELEAVGEEVQQIGTEMQLRTTFEELPKGEAIVKPPKFKENPDGTQRISDDYYGLKREEGGKLVFDATEKTPATTNERLAAQGFYYNPQNKKKGEFNLFDGSPDMLFQKYEPEIVQYLSNLESTSPDIYKNLQSKIEAGNFTQQDQFNIISEIEGKKAIRLNQDLEIAAARIEALMEQQQPLMVGEEVLEEGQELPPEVQELSAYIQEKLPQLEEAEMQLQTLYQNYPEEVDRQWTQSVLEDRWEKSSGLGALTPGMDIMARKTVNIVPNFVNSTGQFLSRAVGANESANAWNNFWESATYTTPSTPIVTTNPETGETEIDWANAMTEVGPQLVQMYLVFGKAAGLIQTGTQSLVSGEISKNTGLFVAGYFASYKDLYDQAKGAKLSDEDAHSYASLVAMGIAATELIMPDRNFFKQGAEEALQLTIREAAKGTKGKAMTGALGEFFLNIGKEQAEEFSSDLVSNASAVVADGIMDGANFDAQLFDKEGIMTTAIVTGLTAGLAGSGKLVGDLKQRNRDLYALSQNYENFTTQLQTLVEAEQVTPEQAERLTQEVEALRVAETKVPPTMPVENKAVVVPLVAEKEQLVEEKKELDPIFHAPIDQRIEEIDNEILTETKQKEDAVQVEKAGQVPVQPETGGGQEIQGRQPEPEPQKVAEQISEEKVVEETASPLNQTLSKYGWTSTETPKGFEVSNAKGKPVANVQVKKDGSYAILDMAGTKLLSGKGKLEQSVEKIAKDYFFAKEKSPEKVIKTPAPEVKKEATKEGEMFTSFEQVVMNSKSPKEAFKAVQSIQGVSPEVAKAFREKYDPEQKLSPEQAFNEFYNEVKGKKAIETTKQRLEKKGYTVSVNERGGLEIKKEFSNAKEAKDVGASEIIKLSEKGTAYVLDGELIIDIREYNQYGGNYSAQAGKSVSYDYGDKIEVSKTPLSEVTEGEALEADTEGSPTETGTEQKVTPEQEAKAKEYGYANPFQAVASVNKFTGKDYTVSEFDTIPDTEFKKASEQSETVKKNKATESKLADIQARRQSIKERLAEKIKDSRGKLGSGIDPSILKDLIELGATYIEEGIVKAKDFVARMREDMKELGLDDSKVTDKEIKSKIFDKAKSPLPPEQVGAIEQKNDAYPEGKDETFPPSEKTKTGGSQKIKSVIDAYANRSNMPEDLRQGLIDQVGLYYTQLSNEQTFALGKEIIDALGMESAINEALTSPDMAPVLRVMILGSGINEYKAQQKATKIKEEIDELSDKQNNLKDKLDLMARDYGRAIQLLYPIYQVSGIAAKRKIQQIIDKRNKGKEPKVKQAVKEIEEVVNDEKITKDDLENASEFDQNSLEARLKEAEKRIRELEKDPTKATTKKVYARTVSKEVADKALKQLLGKAYAFPALDPEVFKNIKIVGTYAMESLIIKGQASYQNFHDLLSRKLRGKYKSAYADLYKEIAKDLEGVEGLETAETVDESQSQIDYFERVAKFVKNPDNAVVRILKNAGYTKTNKNGKESIDWTKVITDRTSVAAAVASLNKELSKLNLSRSQLATLEKIAEEKIRAAVEARKVREIQKIIERNENNALVRTLKKANRKSKVDKLVELARMGALNNTQIRDIVADELGIVTLTDEAVARIDELQELLEKAPKGFVSSKIEEEIAFITAQYKLDFMWEVYRERFFMRMLSGFATFIKNATGIGVALTRTLQVAARTKGNKKVASVLGNQFKEASAVFAQVFRNGGVDKGIAFLDYTGQKAGIPRIRYAEYHKFRPLGITLPIKIKGVNLNPFTALLDNEKYIGRILGATDAFVQTLSSGLKQYEYEYLMQAKANPDFTSAQVAQLAYDNLYSIELNDAKEIAEKELSESGLKYNQRDVNRRAYEVIERARNPKTVERGETVAQQDAFKAPDGIGIFPFVAQGLSGVKRSVEYMVELEGIKDTPIATALTSMSRLLGDSIIPFVGGVSNVMEKALELNPVYGIPKAALNRLVGANLSKSNPERADFYKDKSVDLTLRASIGLFYFGLFMAMMEASRMLAPDDDEESYTGIFGKGSEQYSEDEVIKLLRKKNTIRMFGMDFSLDYFGTMGIALKNYALLKDLERYDAKFKKEGVWDNIMAALAIVVTEQFKSSFFESMGRFSGFVTSPTKDANQKYIASQFSNILATHVIPFTNLIRQTGQALNPQAKMALDLPDLLLKYSGLTAGYGLKPAFDYRGREYDTGDIYASSADGLFKMFTQKFAEGDEIDRFLLGNGIAVTSPSRVSSNPENNKLMIYNSDGTSRPLTQEEFYEYKKIKADRLNELLKQDIAILRDEAKYLQAKYTKEEAERRLQDFFSTNFNTPAIDYALEVINKNHGHLETYLHSLVAEEENPKPVEENE